MSSQTLAKVTEFSEETICTFARQNLKVFSRYLGFKNAGFHDTWYSLLQPMNNPLHFSPLREHPSALKKFHFEAPRKHGKSQCVAINYPAWLIGNYPDIHITIVSKTATLSEESLSEIIRLVEGSEPRSMSCHRNLPSSL